MYYAMNFNFTNFDLYFINECKDLNSVNQHVNIIHILVFRIK